MLDLTGIWAEEIDALAPAEENSFTYNGTTYPAKLLCDLIHANDTEVLASYEKRFYAGTPCITKNNYGNGKSYYVGTRSNEAFYQNFIKDVCKEAEVSMVLYEGLEEQEYPVSGLEITKRTGEEAEFIFIMNHQMVEKEVTLPFAAKDLLLEMSYEAGDKIVMPAMDCAVLKKSIL